jgi:hypothetical protein
MPLIPTTSISDLPLGLLTPLRVLMTLLIVIIGLPLFKLLRMTFRTYMSPIRDLPGPSGGNILLGYSKEIGNAQAGEWHLAMVEKYGHVLRYRSLLGVHFFPLFTILAYITH